MGLVLPEGDPYSVLDLGSCCDPRTRYVEARAMKLWSCWTATPR